MIKQVDHLMKDIVIIRLILELIQKQGWFLQLVDFIQKNTRK